jgi:hypothetical protein
VLVELLDDPRVEGLPHFLRLLAREAWTDHEQADDSKAVG